MFYIVVSDKDCPLYPKVTLGVCQDAGDALRKFNDGLAKTHRLGTFRILEADEQPDAVYSLEGAPEGSPWLKIRLRRVAHPAADDALLAQARAANPGSPAR